MKPTKIIKLLFAFSIMLIGLVIILLPIPDTSMWNKFFANVGLAFIVAGFVSLFHISVLENFDRNELIDALIAKFLPLLHSPVITGGLKLVTEARREFNEYYHWTTSQSRQELFFAGRSVLHRIDNNLRGLEAGGAVSAIARRLRQGASLKILFLDPRSHLVEPLAYEGRFLPHGEKETLNDFLANLHQSLIICEKLHETLKDENIPAILDIRIYDTIPYFAYHKVDSRVIVGFYFSSFGREGARAAYEVEDNKTMEFFEDHFDGIFGHARRLLFTPDGGARVRLDENLVRELHGAIADKMART